MEKDRLSFLIRQRQISQQGLITSQQMEANIRTEGFSEDYYPKADGLKLRDVNPKAKFENLFRPNTGVLAVWKRLNEVVIPRRIEKLTLLDQQIEETKQASMKNALVKPQSEYSRIITPYVQAVREARTLSPEEFRKAKNALISEVNKFKANAAIKSGSVSANATTLISKPQIPAPEFHNKFLTPIRMHHGLGTLSIYRDRQIPGDLQSAIEAQVTTLMPQDKRSADVALAILFLLPEHIIRMKSFDIKSYEELAGYVVSIANAIGRYDAGLLNPPTAEELGVRSHEQDQYIETQMRALLAHFLREELIQPNRTEKEIEVFYRQLNDYIRHTIEHITPKIDHLKASDKPRRKIDRTPGLRDSYDRVGKIIEHMPGLEGVMLASRLSTTLWEDLSLPCLDYMDEVRIAEVLRNIANSVSFRRENKTLLAPEGFIINPIQALNLSKIIELIQDRLEDENSSFQVLFQALESLEYGEEAILRLFRISHEEEQTVLYEALYLSGCFRKLRSKLRLERN